MDNIPKCPLCGSERTAPAGQVQTQRAIVDERRCLACGEVFYVDDNGKVVSLDS